MKLFLAILLSCGFFYVVIATREKRQAQLCNTPDNTIGICVMLPNCPSLLNFYAANGGSRQVVAYLKAAQRNCGNRVVRGEPLVCCEQAYNQQRPQPSRPTRPQRPQTTQPSNPFLPEPFRPTTTRPPTRPPTTSIPTLPPRTTAPPQIDDRANDCRGPDAREGTCKSLTECPVLLNRLQNNPNDADFAEFLRNSNVLCNAAPPVICCPTGRELVDEPILTTTTQRTLPTVQEVRLLTPEEGCGFSNTTHKKIVGGEPAKLGSWPWIALLGYVDNLGQASHKCGGTLITKRHVVTAAHCLRRDLRYVRLGEHDLSTDSETRHVDINIAKVDGHPDYDRRDGHSDIAVLFLARDVQFSDFIRPICVPQPNQLQTKRLVGFTPFVAGWGRTLEGGESADVLQELQLPILDNTECSKRYQDQNRLISEKQFNDAVVCAGVLTGGKDTCQGDSGGPLMLPERVSQTAQFHFTLLGVVSYGIGCARAGVPGVYSSVPYFSNWIRQKIAEPY